jgi:hypothetical protein
MGKALSHKVEGKHHHISGEMLRKYGAPEEVALGCRTAPRRYGRN